MHFLIGFSEKHGGGFLKSIGRGVSKGLAKTVPKIVKAAKPIGRKIVKQGISIAKNKKNQKKLIKMAASVGGDAVSRMSGDTQMGRLAQQQINAAAGRARKQ